MRLESYQHAQNHGICAGKNIAGVKTEYTSIPGCGLINLI